MRVVIASIAANNDRLRQAPTSLSLLYLTLATRRAGFAETDAREYYPEQGDTAILDDLLGQPFDVLALSCYIWNITRLEIIARAVKEQRPQVKIVVGGPEVGPVAREVLERNRCVDLVVRGEGEETLVELLRALQLGTPLGEVQGLTYRASSSEICSSPDRSPAEDLGQIPSPYLEDDFDHAHSRYLNLETSRGCLRRCRFCQWPSQQLRFFPLDRVLAELALIARLPRLQRLYIIDSSLLASKERALVILDALKNNFRPEVHIYFEMDMDRIDEEIVDRFVGLGNVTLSFGLQTTNPQVARTIRRPTDLDRFAHNVRSIRRRAPQRKISFDLIFGLPGDTLQTYRESLEWALARQPDMLHLQPYFLLVGSEFYRRREEFGLEFDPQPPRQVYSTHDFPKADLEKARRLSYYVQLIHTLPRLRIAVDLLWHQLARQHATLGRVELYEELIDYLEDRIDLTADWGLLGDVGWQGFGNVLRDPDRRQQLDRLFAGFSRERVAASHRHGESDPSA